MSDEEDALRQQLLDAAMLYAVCHEHLHDTHWPLIQKREKRLEEAAEAYAACKAEKESSR